MLLDFVQIGAITFEQAEFSLEQKAKDDEDPLATLFRHTDGNIHLGENALDYREERLAKIPSKKVAQKSGKKVDLSSPFLYNICIN